MGRTPPFDAAQLTSISKILGDTNNGLTGTEIAALLAETRIPDVDPFETKWRRLHNAFVEFQNQHRFGNHVVVFINNAMRPVRYLDNPARFEERRLDLNVTLAFAGLSVNENGKVCHAWRARNINEAIELAGKLRSTLASRQVHPDVLAHCRAELVVGNYFHAVFEAMKSIASKIRSISGLTTDGSDLVTSAFALGKDCSPVLAINSLATETERGEQRGFVNLLVGMFGLIRNPAGHNPKIEWPMDEQDALDVLTMVSLVHRKLDKARRLK